MDKISLKNIKDYLPFITIVPPILGGIVQIIFLGSFGISYIRFFSLSQALIDGLIILGVCFSVFLGLFIPDFLSSFYYKFISSNKKFNKINSKIELFVEILLIFILFSIPFYLSYKIYFSIILNQYSITISSFFLSSFLFSLFFNFAINKLSFLLHSYNFEEKITDGVLTVRDTLRYFVLNIFLIFIMGYFLYFTNKSELVPNYIYTIFSLPDSLVNNFNLNLDKKSRKVIYFNDKYIFIKNTSNNEIEIVKFDALFK